MELLVVLAIVPVIFLCSYIYKKDLHREPKKLLISIFIWGALTCIPAVILETFFGDIFITEDTSLPFLEIFINVFFGIALIEELGKWVVTKIKGYKSREFDEIYDIIVYSVFASLGFACLENIGYVLENGIGTAIMRAVISIPGHACFGILMGYYMSKAKVNEMNGSFIKKKKNMFLSLFIPTLFHAIYDSLLSTDSGTFFLLFFVFDIFMVIYCFGIVKKMSKIQNNVSTNIENGKIKESKEGLIDFKKSKKDEDVKFCPICGKNVEGMNFCPSCGFKIK